MRRTFILFLGLVFWGRSSAQIIDTSGSSTFCFGDSVILTVKPATGITGYQWIRGATDIPGATSGSYTAKLQASYSVRLTRQPGADTIIGPVAVTVNQKPVVNINPASICNGGSANLTATGADAYTWSPASGLSATTGSSVIASPSATTKYTVTGKNLLTGCVNTDTATVTVTPLPAEPLFTFSNQQCSGIPFNFNVSSPVPGFTYTWDFGDGFTGTGSSVNHLYNAIGNGTQTFAVKVTATVGPGCSTPSQPRNVTVKQKPDAELLEANNFRFCGNIGNAALNVTDISTPAMNTNYEIIWGDTAGNYQSENPPSNLAHTYATGIYSLVYNVTGTNGCIGSKLINVLNITNPRIGAGIPANASGCGPLTICFPLNEFQSNHSSTIYKVDFGDGSAIRSFSQPPPDSVCHTYYKTSCGDPGTRFSFQIQAINGCDTSYGNFSPIRVFTKPLASFTTNPQPGCVNSLIKFTNTTIFGYNNSCSISATYTWDFGDNTPVVTVLTNATQTHAYSTPGTYQVKLTAQNTCDTSSYTLPVCIEGKSLPSFSLTDSSGCIPFIVGANNTTNLTGNCQPLKYKWLVSYTANFCGNSPAFTFNEGTSDTSANPSFSFTNPGAYRIYQTSANSCGTDTSSRIVNVKKPPTVSISLPSYSCGIVNVTPVAVVNACTDSSLTFAWTFNGGMPENANTSDPGNITFSTTGTHLITLAVTNDCGTTTYTDSVVVTAAPDVLASADKILCGGTTAGPFTFSSTIGTPTYSWKNSNTSIGLAADSTGNIPAFTTINNGTAPAVATIIVTPNVSSCLGTPDTFTIIINPRPTAPLVTPSLTYCQNSPANILMATGTGTDTLTWYSNPDLNNGTLSPPTPSTDTPGIFLFYVTQTNLYSCLSGPSLITVIVNSPITGNIINNNQDICANTAPDPLSSGTIAGSNGSYTYQWQSLPEGSSLWSNVTGANSSAYAPGILSDTIQYRRIINSPPCADTSNIITITVAGALTNFGISADQVICEGFTPQALSGDLPSGGGGGYVYQWEQSTDGNTWTAVGGNTNNYQPPALISTTFYRRIVNAAQCTAISNVVTVTVNLTPAATITAVKNTICFYDSGSVQFNATAGLAPFNATLLIIKPDLGTDTIKQTINNNGPLSITVIAPNSGPGAYTIQLIELTDNKNCQRMNLMPPVTITVKALPGLVLTNSSPVCSGVSAVLTANGADTYTWSPNQFINTTTGNIVSVMPPSTTTYFVRGILEGCFKDTSTLVTVIAGAVVADAGLAQILCSTDNTNLAGNLPSANSTGLWSQVDGPLASITAANQASTAVTGLTPGNSYVFRWTITGQAPCPPTADEVKIEVLSPIINAIKNDTVICKGQSFTILNDELSGGSSAGIDSVYTFQWESTPAGFTNWQSIAGATTATLVATPDASTCYRRTVITNGICQSFSNAVCLTVNPTITNNIITTDQQVCVNTPVNNLQGSAPNGGDNIYTYQWQTSTDSIGWSSIATTVSYQPPIYVSAGTHYFRRNVASGNCTAQSNVITIRVRPDAKAIFTGNPGQSCAMFNLATAISVIPLPDSNGAYNWYADGILFGSNNTGIFPGYTITNPGDTVNIKLVTTSQFGCKPDSIEQRFITVTTAVAAFTKDKTNGCTPLNVVFNNTSSNVDGNTQFFWDFGNGFTSRQLQPGSIIFVQSPSFNDTTYQITLKIYNGCDTTVQHDTVKIRANPKARFGVDNTSGCSPFIVHLTNNSLGGPNTYYWDFGNGHRDTTFATGSLDYTYNIGNTVDTLPIRLIAVNECASDSQVINVRIAPNAIKPQITIGATELFGCTPHTVVFNNATIGATSFTWDYGDNTLPDVTNNNQSEVSHTFENAGIFTIAISMTNGCSDTIVYTTVTVFAKPEAAFTTNSSVYCPGDTVRVNNHSLNASNYSWFWGDGQSSTGFSPTHLYTMAGNYTILLRAEKTNKDGIVCSDTLVQSIRVPVKPDVRVQSNITGINCTPFILNATAPGIINEAVSWHVSDTAVASADSIQSGISLEYTFTKAGTYSVKMIAVNAFGCKDSTTFVFTVRGTPAAAFTPLNIALCKIDTTVSYLNTTAFNDNGPLTFRWLVNGLQQSNNGNFTFRYVTPATTILPVTFTTQLIATNTAGCSDTATGSLQMKPLPKASFSLNNTNDCVPFILSVSNTSQYSTSYRWFLNGNLIDTGANPAIAITKAATVYKITLVADNEFSCGADMLFLNFTSRIKPEAVFSLQDTLGCDGNLNIIIANQSTDAQFYQWDWGDNSPTSPQAIPPHSYSFPGHYLITLVASDGTCRDTTAQTVTVATRPVVNFSADNTLACDTATIHFTNLTNNADTYLWSFSDGTTSTAVNPVKSFAPGPLYYTVILTAINKAGCKDSLIRPNLIFAIDPPLADFQINPSPVITVPDYTFTFNTITLNSNKYTYKWSLGDGAFDGTRDVIHKYADTGNYPVTLIVLDTSTGCTDTATKIAVINGNPGYLYVPNAFYPNSIRNEFKTFKPLGKGLSEYQLQIFDSWGKLLYESRALDAAGSPTAGWDGSDKGKPMAQDAYAWRIIARFRSGKLWEGMHYNNKAAATPGHTFGTLTLFR